MESLALLAAIIILISVIGGPLSFLFAWLLEKKKASASQHSISLLRIYTALVILFGLPALVVGVRLITLDIALGGKVFGVFGVATSSAALFKLFRSRR